MTDLAAPAFLERDEEVSTLAGLAAGATRREGALVLVEGPAGIGKTSLLRVARETARERGLTPLGATASELDREFPFGLVNQLFGGVLASADAERRERLLAGAARMAEQVLSPSAPLEPGSDPSHTVLHGLYWFCANLAEEEPLLLVVDDLHWADRSSLRFLEFLGRRIEDLPVLVLTATRPREPGADQELLAALAGGPSATVLRPAPLSAAAVAELMAEALGEAPETEFAATCESLTGGIPLLVRELARSARERGLRGQADDAERIAEIASSGLAAAVRRRLAGLGEEATRLARAAAVLGDRVRLDDLAALSGLSEEEAARASDTLVRADVLDADTRAFVHPLMREAVAAEIAPAENAPMHGQAARRLADRGARAIEIAVHLLPTDPAGDPWVAETLRRAARDAAAEGAPETAIAYLRRALQDMPPGPDRLAAQVETAELEVSLADQSALARLDDALAEGLEPDLAARAQDARAYLYVIRHEPDSARAALEEALGLAGDPALRTRIESRLLDITAVQLPLADDRAELLARLRGDGDPSPVVLGHMAFDAGYRAEPRDRAVDYGGRALAGGALLAAVGAHSATYQFCIQGLRLAEAAEQADRAIDAAWPEVRRTGSALATWYLNYARAQCALMFQPLPVAEEAARSALAIALESGLGAGLQGTLGVLVEVLLERDQLDEAADLIEGLPLEGPFAEALPAPSGLAVRALVRRRQRRDEEAEADLRRAIELLDLGRLRAPLKSRARLRLAEMLGERGDRDEALALLDEAEAAAREAGTGGALGCVLRSRGRVLGGDDGIEMVRAAVEALAGSPLRLDHAWALHDLGALVRRSGKRADARDPLREAIDLADRLGATQLLRVAQEELLATGARPTRRALTGPESLTPSERRVAELAAEGLSNREIAESLWVTRKTVELHLGNAYGKLGIRGRQQLADALA